MTSSAHLRIDENLNRRLDRLHRKFPSLRTRSSLISFALYHGLQVLLTESQDETPRDAVQ